MSYFLSTSLTKANNMTKPGTNEAGSEKLQQGRPGEYTEHM